MIQEQAREKRGGILAGGGWWWAMLFFCGPVWSQAGDEVTFQFMDRARQLTYEGRRSGEGYFSETGKKLVFQSEREVGNPFYQIYILDLENGETHRVSPGRGKTTCAYFRPGTDRILFSSTHLDSDAVVKQESELELRESGKSRRYAWDYDAAMDIFSAARDGSDLRRLTEAVGYDAEGAYSPDGSKIVFCSLRHAYPESSLSEEDRKQLEVDPSYFGEIYLMNADGSGVQRLTWTDGYDGGPFFSPDGSRIVWRRFDEKGALADIYTMNTDGGDVRRLTSFGAMSWAPYFHPSGDYVIFAANKEGFGNFELYLVDTAGGREPVRVTHADGFDGLPVFGPEGDRLVWTSNRTSTGQSQIFMARWHHGAALAALAEAPERRDVESPGTGLEAEGVAAATGPVNEEISAEELRDHVEWLAADALEGRMTGSKGATKAAAYLAKALEQMGVEPLPGVDGYLQPFDYTAGVRVVPDDNYLALVREQGEPPVQRFELEEDFRPLAFTANEEVEADVVFAGYGLSVPGEKGKAYDSYRGLDVTNKVVLILRYVPEEVSAERRQELNRYAGLRYKAMVAREHGAQALLVVTGPNSPKSGRLAELNFDSSLAGSGIVAASVGTNVANALLSGSGRSLAEAQTELDRENPHATGGFGLPGVRVRIEAAVERVVKTDNNVVGWLPPAAGEADAPVVLAGAHYDHLGYGESGSREVKDEEGEIHNGADDNASGVSAILEVAERLALKRAANSGCLKQGVVFGFWSGEELGLIGSSRFVEDPPIELGRVSAYLNFDMVGRLRENKLTLQGVGSSRGWRKEIEKANVPAGFDLVLQEDPYLPTDTTAFYPKQIPVLSFFTGSHEHYHRPTDDPETLNYEGLERITQFAGGLIANLAGQEAVLEYVQVERSETGGNRDRLRVYLGTIPDYTAEGQGVKLTGVRGGSPADKGGLKGGDVIVEFAGQQIENIYDYTYAIDAAKVGEKVTLVVVRDGERVMVEVVPEAR